MRALVIGGNGFIGSHLVDKLLTKGWEVVVYDLHERRYEQPPKKAKFIKGDLAQSYLVREALTGIDVVFHLAWSNIHEVSNKNPEEDIKTNLIPSIHLLEASRLMGVKKIIFVSSGGTVYGPALETPIKETHPNHPTSSYGITKLAVEKYLHMFHKLYGLEYVILRPSVPYGPRQNPMGRQGAAAVFLYRISQNIPISIWGNGDTLRDYFYISDLSDAFLAGAERQLTSQRIFNIGGHEEISLNALIEHIEPIVGKKAIVEYQEERKFDASRIVLDTTNASRYLDWNAKVPLSEGLKKTWHWMSSVLIS